VKGQEKIDYYTCMIYLELPGSRVVLLQAFFESYEGLGVVRTLDIRQGLVCILTTPDMLSEALAVLEAEQDSLAWRFAEKPDGETLKRYLGYGRNKSGRERSTSDN